MDAAAGRTQDFDPGNYFIYRRIGQTHPDSVADPLLQQFHHGNAAFYYAGDQRSGFGYAEMQGIGVVFCKQLICPHGSINVGCFQGKNNTVKSELLKNLHFLLGGSQHRFCNIRFLLQLLRQ